MCKQTEHAEYHKVRLGYDNQFVVPYDIRQALHWQYQERMLVTIHNIHLRSVLIQPEQARCSLCMVFTDGLTVFHHGWVCRSCLKEIKRRFRGWG